jgi:hypothetical protein
MAQLRLDFGRCGRNAAEALYLSNIYLNSSRLHLAEKLYEDVMTQIPPRQLPLDALAKATNAPAGTQRSRIASIYHTSVS